MYRFPRTRFAGTNTLDAQLDHIEEELMEVRDADKWIDKAAETLDLIHSAETYLRMLQERKGINVADIAAGVERKNRERGYY